MISRLRQTRYQALLAWLALAAMLLRSVIPAGYMPVHSNTGAHSIQLAFCHASSLGVPPHLPEGIHSQPEQCPFAFAAMAAIPPVPQSPPSLAAVDSAEPGVPYDVAGPSSLHSRPPARGPPRYA